MTAVLDALARVEAALADLRALLTAESAPPAPSAPPSRLLTPADLEDAAQALGVPLETIKAVKAVESGPLGGFAADGRPIILFEPHVFSRLTNHRFDATQGGVSYPRWGMKPYPKAQADRWAQLEYAANLDHDAAWQSASAGLFQIMGFNWAACGFPSLSEFWDAMHRSERDHLMAFIGFIRTNNLARHLAAQDWLAFATAYNGPGQAQAYADKLKAAFAVAGAQA